MSKRDFTVPTIHAITNDDILASPSFVARAREVMEALGTRGAVHLRAQSLAGSLVYLLAEKLAEAQRATESWLVVNDRVDIALAVGARGVQLTSRSIGLSDAASIAPGVALGASVHSIREVDAAEKAGAAWLVAGHVYATASHPAAAPRGEDFVAEVAWRTALPVIAIGGIAPSQVGALKRAGAQGVAVIRGIWSERDVAAAASDYLSRYDADGDR